MKALNNKKKLIAVIISVSVVLVALITVLIVRAVIKNRPPELDEVRDRIEELIEGAREVNEIFWGEGLPTYPRVYRTLVAFEVYADGNSFTTQCPAGQTEDDAKDFYYYVFPDDTHGTVIAYQYVWRERESGGNSYTFTDMQSGVLLTGEYDEYRYAKQTDTHGEGCFYCSEGGKHYELLEEYTPHTFFYESTDEKYYDYVREDSGYLSVDDIKAKAELVYSAEYLSSIYQSLFDGIMVSEGAHGMLYARYRDKEIDGAYYLIKSNQQEGYELGYRVFDYSTMKMERKSNASFITVSMETYLRGKEDERVTVRLSFALENGQWFLASPSY